MTSEHRDDADFFISRNGADREWAVWIAQTLEANGHNTIIQDWDFLPGQNFVLRMLDAAERCKRTIGVISPNYLAADFTQPEWAAAFAQDPRGEDRKFIPVLVESVILPRMLAPTIFINLVGLSQEAATAELLDGVGEGRRKPATQAPFPGSALGTATSARIAPQDPDYDGGDLLWRPLNAVPTVQWRHAEQASYMSSSGSQFELHLVPLEPQRVEVRRLATLPSELISIGRRTGLFTAGEEVLSSHDAVAAVAESASSSGRRLPSAGMMVTRSGQRSIWIPMPADSMGPVFDATFMAERLSEMLERLVDLPVANSQNYVIAAAITSPMMLTVNRVSTLGNRSSASGLRTDSSSISLPPDDFIPFAALAGNLTAVAEEVSARLAAAVGT
jgi:hypothetical protein